MMSAFIQKYHCTKICKALNPPTLQEIPWTTGAKEDTPLNPHINSKRPQVKDHDLKLISIVCQGSLAQNTVVKSRLV
ncbi:hypothetical protein PSTT_06904 [Puccinia striiformis]|uniref:Alpha-type protein kinase domain-containing protein n=3 Tax=Puccinia striiformis TaxID=27350 RepID=A0A0L0VSJ2_9BASI|nr:hypothetical protein PSTG_04679 [Puccinia striiformis f. sp. tritici PST-78]POW09327.1 hypothetical protein PSTT_06904 [Puccinia striiformis]